MKSAKAVTRARLAAIAVAIIAWLLLVSALFAHPHAYAAVPESCRAYQRHLTAEAFSIFGPRAPIPVLAAQIQQESGCRAGAISPVGAQGLTQFMPATAESMARLYPTELGPADPLNWRWAIGAQVRYMRDLVRVPWRTECDTWAAKLSSYNGGEGWLRRDQAVCRSRTWTMGDGCEPCIADRWFGNVELHPDPRRAPANVRENRAYPRRILLHLMPQYVAAGYGRGLECLLGD